MKKCIYDSDYFERGVEKEYLDMKTIGGYQI